MLVMADMSRRRIVLPALALVWALSATACMGRGGTARYGGVATYIGQRDTGIESAEALPLTIGFTECFPFPAGGSLPATVLEAGPSCRLVGTWVTFQGTAREDAHWGTGAFELTPGQLCRLPLRDGEVAVRVASGFVKVDDADTVDVTIGGVLASGPRMGAPSSMHFASAEVRPLDAVCR